MTLTQKAEERKDSGPEEEEDDRVIFDHSYDSNTTSVQYLDVLGSVCKVEETIKTKCWSIKRCVINAVRVGVDVKILSSWAECGQKDRPSSPAERKEIITRRLNCGPFPTCVL